MARITDNTPAAKELRQRMTPAEERLWQAVRSRQAGGVKIRRQHAIGPYVVDFAVPAVRLCIELDGGVHSTKADDDAYRTSNLEAAGYRVLRFPNARVFDDLDAVLDEIAATVSALREA